MATSVAPLAGLIVAPIAALFVAVATGNGSGSDGRWRAVAVAIVAYAAFLLPLAFDPEIETMYRALFVGDSVIWRTPWERQFSHVFAGVAGTVLAVVGAVVTDRESSR